MALAEDGNRKLDNIHERTNQESDLELGRLPQAKIVLRPLNSEGAYLPLALTKSGDIRFTEDE